MSIPTELNTDQLKKEFEKYDQNKDGVLDAHEIKIIIDDMHAKSNQYYSECQSKQRESRRMSILPKISLPSNIQNLTNNLLKSPKKENVRNSTSSNRRKSNSSVSPRLSSKVSPRGSCCDTEVTDSGRSSYWSFLSKVLNGFSHSTCSQKVIRVYNANICFIKN